MPPKNVEYVTDEFPVIVVSINVIKATPLVAPVVWNAPVVVGKSSELVEPVT